MGKEHGCRGQGLDWPIFVREERDTDRAAEDVVVATTDGAPFHQPAFSRCVPLPQALIVDATQNVED